MRVRWDDIDEPVLDLDTATIHDGVFMMTGTVSLQGGALLYERMEKRSRKWVVKPIVLVVEDAVGYSIDDDAGTGQLNLEAIENKGSTVTFTGTIPCTVVVKTGDDEEVYFLLDRGTDE